MQALLTTLTAFSLAIHALVGCCWHHAQRCDCGAESTALAANVESRCQHCHHACHDHAKHHRVSDRQADEGQSTTPTPCPCKVECHGFCTYLPPEKSPLESAADGPAFALPLNPLVHDSTTDSLAAHWEWLADPGDSAQPLRIHLLHQIFLI
ncbi:MAG TPA: hypothetical protein VGJ26_12260 [Pirellulales bacterium]|jgi:hypothetical protein